MKTARLTPQPHIWPGLQMGMELDVEGANRIVVSRAVCLEPGCGWTSAWYQWARLCHQAGFDHQCGALW